MVSRRGFLSTLGNAAAAAFLPQPRGGSGMFISLPPWAVARNVGWPEQARLAARVGYGGIDWAFAPAKQAGLDATRALFSELKIQPTITNLPLQGTFAADDAEFAARLQQLPEDAAFAAAIGCRRFQLVLPASTPVGVSKEQRWTTVRTRVKAVAAVLAVSDVRLGLEFLGPLVFRNRGGGPFVFTLPETVQLAAECGANVGVTLDAWHWHHSGGTAADIIGAGRSRIVHVHVSDARAMAPELVQDNMRLLPGEGVIDLQGFFRALAKTGYDGGVAPETIGPRIPDAMPPEESAAIALKATAAVMKAAGV